MIYGLFNEGTTSCLTSLSGNKNIIVIDENQSSDIQQEIIKKSCLVIGARYHSVVFAINNEIPFVSLSYEHKMKGLLEVLDMTDRMVEIQDIFDGKSGEFEKDMANYCRRMMDIQISGLVKRMTYAGLDHCVVGISGGVDSTLTVMICAEAVKRMGLPSTNVVACTLPCFGTSSRTKSNAIIVAEQVGAEVRVIDIGESVYKHFDDIGHAHDDYSIAFENAQARERTQVLMDIANKVNGLDVGTEDLSEFVDGWCTYNGDHTSMYDVNMGLTKTQVREGVRYIARTTDNKILADALWDVLDCPVTPELLPIHDDQIEQKSEENVGSYSLQDFFTHKMMICGFSPAKTMRLAKAAYGDEYSDEELTKWLRSYCKRYFSQQFKRSCLMDGPSVEAFSVSPRVGFLIPSDAENTLFMESLDTVAKE